MEKELQVDVGYTKYPLMIGWDNLDKIVRLIPRDKKLLIVTDENVFKFYRERFEHVLVSYKREKNLQWLFKIFPPGEETKTLERAKELYDEASWLEMDRDSYFVAFGGGVIGDLTGFVASTYMRGTKFLQLPTTLLAQVDSSVGGKVAVNHPRQKNLIGSFYHPEGVLMELAFLETLPKRDFNSGLAEIIKSAILWDREFFYFIKEFMEKENYTLENPGVREDLVHIVARACEIKARVVKEDEKDHGLRQILNLGHTFAHALEGVANYSYFKHGEAVMWGMIFAAELSYAKGLLSRVDKEEIISLIGKLNPPTFPENLNPKELLSFFQTDKKKRDNVIPFILPLSIGKVEVRRDISPKEAIAVIDKYC